MMRLQEERKLQRLREVLAFALMFYSLSVCYIRYLLNLVDHANKFIHRVFEKADGVYFLI